MSDIKEIWSNFDGSSAPMENVPFIILEAQSNAINKYKETNEVYSTIVTSSGDGLKVIKHVLYLLPIFGNGYNYRYIEFTQPVDSIFPIAIKAFQVGNIDFGIVTEDQGANGIYDVLNEIFKDKRTEVVFNQLKAMGNTIKSWKNEKNS